MVSTVAALYVDEEGPYTKIEGVDCWGVSRDARNYVGPNPVVAHPPCNRWGRLAPVNHKRWGTPIGQDGGCFEHALWAVRSFGGVLEHPAHTIAWRHYGLTKPTGVWSKCGSEEWVGEVWQSDYGHKATKKTWLLYTGSNPPENFRTWRKKGTHQVGGGINSGNNKKPRLKQVENHLTPPEFADYLVRLARGSK